MALTHFFHFLDVGQVLKDTFCCTRTKWPQRNRKSCRGPRSSCILTSEATALQPQLERKRSHLERNKSSSCPNIVEESTIKPITEEDTRLIKDAMFKNQIKPLVPDAAQEVAQPSDFQSRNLFNSPQQKHNFILKKRPSPMIVYTTSSNMDVYNAVIYEEEDDESLMPPDGSILNHRRLSTSLPFGLNLIGNGSIMEQPITLESTV